jgi:hypothetical protein
VDGDLKITWRIFVNTKILAVIVLLSHVSLAYATDSSEKMYPPLESVIENLGQGCRIKVDLPSHAPCSSCCYKTPSKHDPEYPVVGRDREGGDIRIYLMNLPQGPKVWSIDFTCYHSDYAELIHKMVYFDNESNRWVLNQHEDYDAFRLPEANFHLYQIKTQTGYGWLATHDETYGEESSRIRNLVYCIFHDERAICGSSDVGYPETIRRNPITDRTSYVLRMVKSIEFLEDVPPIQPEEENGEPCD